MTDTCYCKLFKDEGYCTIGVSVSAPNYKLKQES